MTRFCLGKYANTENKRFILWKAGRFGGRFLPLIAIDCFQSAKLTSGTKQSLRFISARPLAHGDAVMTWQLRRVA
jgi:hypothetical protein